MKTAKIKILFITNDLIPGGVQRLVVDFANSLNKHKFDISIAVLCERPENKFNQSRVLPHIEISNFGFKRFWDITAWYRLYRHIKTYKFDIVFTQLFMSDLFGRTAAFFARTPVIITEIQNLIPSLPKRYIFTDKVLKFITTACISPTDAISDYAKNMIGFSENKIFLIPTNAVDESRFNIPINKETIRGSIGIPKNSRVIITVGRLVEQKGQIFLIRAIPEIIAKKPNSYFVIVGSGALESDLKKEVRRLNIESHIRFLGTRNDIPELLKASDMFVFPSVWEGQGVVLFEAIFSRLPIVASRVGGIPDIIIDEETGLLVRPGDSRELANAIIRVLENSGLSDKLSHEAFKRFGNRTLKNSVKIVENIFDKLLKEY